MLQPTNRLTLIDAMRPPAGFGLGSAMAVTFTLDLRALLAAPAAFALTGADGLTDNDGTYEPIELLHALRSHAGKLTVFSQVGEIALPPSRRVFAFLEQAVIPVRAPRGGVVHPKVWVLRYEKARRRPTADRPIVGSGFSSPAGTSRSTPAGTPSFVSTSRLTRAVRTSSPLGDLFEGLMSQRRNRGLGKPRGAREIALARPTGVRFALPQGVDELHVNVLGLTRTPSPLPAESDRSLIISPFVSDDFFTSVRPARFDELVSRPESLDTLGTTARGHVGSTYWFDDGSTTELDAQADRLSPRDPGRPIVGLHAKVFAFEDGGRARLFLGSANATGRAFTSNVEVLIELVGSVTNLGIDRLCDGTADEPGLRYLFNPWAGSQPADEVEPEAPGLDAARRAVARLSIDGFVEESGTGWAVTYRSPEALPAVDATAIHCWPLASPGNRRSVVIGEPLDVRFEATIETISGFLAFEISHESGAVTQFVVPVPLHNVPEQRERQLLRALVGSAERFLRYVLALLDEDPGRSDLPDAVDGMGADAATDAASRAALPVLEKLLRTMRKDPAKLAGLHPLVADLATDDALPPGFADLWATIYDVALAGGTSP